MLSLYTLNRLKKLLSRDPVGSQTTLDIKKAESLPTDVYFNEPAVKAHMTETMTPVEQQHARLFSIPQERVRWFGHFTLRLMYEHNISINLAWSGTLYPGHTIADPFAPENHGRLSFDNLTFAGSPKAAMALIKEKLGDYIKGALKAETGDDFDRRLRTELCNPTRPPETARFVRDNKDERFSRIELQTAGAPTTILNGRLLSFTAVPASDPTMGFTLTVYEVLAGGYALEIKAADQHRMNTVFFDNNADLQAYFRTCGFPLKGQKYTLHQPPKEKIIDMTEPVTGENPYVLPIKTSGDTRDYIRFAGEQIVEIRYANPKGVIMTGRLFKLKTGDYIWVARALHAQRFNGEPYFYTTLFKAKDYKNLVGELTSVRRIFIREKDLYRPTTNYLIKRYRPTVAFNEQSPDPALCLTL